MTPDEIEIEGIRLLAPQNNYQDTWRTVQMPEGDWIDTDGMRVTDPRPLLAQCAALLDSLLGGPIATQGLIDEIRRVRTELARSGW